MVGREAWGKWAEGSFDLRFLDLPAKNIFRIKSAQRNATLGFGSFGASGSGFFSGSFFSASFFLAPPPCQPILKG
jgi:hypothetical protein